MRSKYVLPFLVLALAAVVYAADTPQAAPEWSMNATIIEACSCPMFCQCYFGPEPAAHHAGGHDSHLCDCLGTCSSGPAAARVPQTLALRLVEVGIVEAPAPPARLTPVATSGDHVLPFANGPPTLA